MGVANPIETMFGIMALIDQTREKMQGTSLAELPWRPTSPDSADELAGLITEPLARCKDPTDALIVVVAAAVTVAQRERERRG